jgi:hypothetical protein
MSFLSAIIFLGCSLNSNVLTSGNTSSSLPPLYTKNGAAKYIKGIDVGSIKFN